MWNDATDVRGWACGMSPRAGGAGNTPGFDWEEDSVSLPEWGGERRAEGWDATCWAGAAAGARSRRWAPAVRRDSAHP